MRVLLRTVFVFLLELREIPRSLLFKRMILVFQMGRVGSNSISFAIQRYPYLEEQGKDCHFEIKRTKEIGDTIILHSHSVTVYGINRYRLTALWRARLGLPLKMICPIREPIARDVSIFFYKYVDSRPNLITNADLGELKELFLEDNRPAQSKTHRLAPANDRITEHQFTLDWFDWHFRPLTRIDVYKHPFPIDRKWQIYNRGRVEVLLYRNDLKNSEQAELISGFLGIKLDEIRPINQGKNKVYAELYSRFRESVKLPEQYIGRMHNSRFAQHFWSPQELKAAADKWRTTSDS